MLKISRSVLIMHPIQTMYQLVEDIESYPEFLPWCSRAQILKKKESMTEATLTLSKGSLSYEFSTRNKMVINESIEMDLLKGPFSRLRGIWTFTVLGKGCKVSLDLEFEIANPLIKAVINSTFMSKVINKTMDAFCQRVEQL